MLEAFAELAGFWPTILLQAFAVTWVCKTPLPSRAARAILAALVLSAPAFCPSRGLLSTFFTGMSVVLACRLTDLGRFPDRERRAALVLWLVCPAVRTLPGSAKERARNRSAVPRVLLRALGKRALWEPIGLGQTLIPDPWRHPLLDTALLILYFVLNLTALADLVIAGARLLGATIDELFDWPLLARSPRDFWSRRWNRFISRFALKHVALPLTGRLSPTLLTLLVFFVSGLFHEYFAWGASGAQTVPLSMTAFFLIQGVAVALGQRFTVGSTWPRAVTHPLTCLWMTVTSPLFFQPLTPPLLAFGVSLEHLPWVHRELAWLPSF